MSVTNEHIFLRLDTRNRECHYFSHIQVNNKLHFLLLKKLLPFSELMKKTFQGDIWQINWYIQTAGECTTLKNARFKKDLITYVIEIKVYGIDQRYCLSCESEVREQTFKFSVIFYITRDKPVKKRYVFIRYQYAVGEVLSFSEFWSII